MNPDSPIRVLHFADTHFGVEIYGRLDPATGTQTRLEDFKRSLMSAIDAALAEGIDLAVFAGDAYKGRDPSQTHQRAFAECLRKLTSAGVPVVLLVGNHDIPQIRGRATAIEIYRTLGVELMHVISSPEVITVDTARGKVQIAGMPFLVKGFALAKEDSVGKSPDDVRDMIESIYATQFDRLAKACDPTLPTICMGHFWVTTAKLSDWQTGYFNNTEPKVSIELLRKPEFDYVALGHIHKHQDLNPNGYPSVVYSGSPDCIDFGERDEVKGFVIVQLARNATTWNFHEIEGRRAFLDIGVNAISDDPTEDVLAAIRKENIVGSVVRLTIRIAEEALPLLRENEIRAALADARYIAGIRRQVQRTSTSRSRELTEGLDPMSALGHYFDQDEKWKSRKPELLELAATLVAQLTAEESAR
ncbi:MAG: exonuclease SbcCD subunit D [Chthonomonadales bacterium]